MSLFTDISLYFHELMLGHEVTIFFSVTVMPKIIHALYLSIELSLLKVKKKITKYKQHKCIHTLIRFVSARNHRVVMV